MATVLDKLESLGFKAGVDYVLQDDGQGPYIKLWLSQRPQPAKPTIDAVTEKAAADAAELRAFYAAFNTSQKDKTLVRWIAARTGGGNPLQWLDELFALWKQSQ